MSTNRRTPVRSRLYPHGMHATIAGGLNETKAIRPMTATLQEEEHGLTERRLAETDVLVWWGHAAHGKVADAVVDRVQQRVWEGMGLIVLHSGHFSKIFKRLMGTPCSLKWREAGERERMWVINRNHPIAKGLGERIELPNTEMYGEPFTVPEPMETVFISWLEGGEVFRSGLTYQRGAGRHLLLRAGTRDLPDLSSPGRAAGTAERRRMGLQSGGGLDRVSGRRPNVPVTRLPERWSRRARSSTRPARKGSAEMATRRMLLLGTGNIAGHHVRGVCGGPGMPRFVACADRCARAEPTAFAESMALTRLRKP